MLILSLMICCIPIILCISALFTKWLQEELSSFTDMYVFLFNCIDFNFFLPSGLPLNTIKPGSSLRKFFGQLILKFSIRPAGDLDKILNYLSIKYCRSPLISSHYIHISEWKSAWRVPVNLTTAESMLVILHKLCLDIYSLYGDNVFIWSYW